MTQLRSNFTYMTTDIPTLCLHAHDIRLYTYASQTAHCRDVREAVLKWLHIKPKSFSGRNTNALSAIDQVHWKGGSLCGGMMHMVSAYLCVNCRMKSVGNFLLILVYIVKRSFSCVNAGSRRQSKNYCWNRHMMQYTCCLFSFYIKCVCPCADCQQMHGRGNLHCWR